MFVSPHKQIVPPEPSRFMDVGEDWIGVRMRRSREGRGPRTSRLTLPLVDIVGQVRARGMVRYRERVCVFCCRNRVATCANGLSLGPRRTLASICKRAKRRLPVQLMFTFFPRNQVSTKDPSLLLVGELLEGILVSTGRSPCAASGTTRSVHTNSTDDRSPRCTEAR